ncbi:PIN domain-like protein [Tricharina praecox]|uniref:PIN domain-like protein n=1 Tax=Tricharina praecox TaxID=43433 RepID=UPI00221F311D|nr:PIN domain-like protein [Tricharina praecox]KAI5858105.1 PIN domain-like protein [Tricharina praecox]
MGIKGLFQIISDNAPNAVRNSDIKQHFGRKVAIDASMSIYQFLIAVRSEGQQLMSDSGETTSHLMGMFYRTLRMVDNGIKPLYVFDGKPPMLKSGELAKRVARKAQAEAGFAEAKESGNAEEMEKYARRTVRVTREQNDDCKMLLKLMGIPYVEAPCEAEAQCATLAREGSVFAAASEDMDTLCFRSPILLRHLTFSEQRKEPIQEIHLDKALAGLEFTYDQFIDMCILLGCDYCDTIPKIGPTTALKMIREHKSLEKVIENLGEKYTVPENWPYLDARALFHKPSVTDPKDLDYKWEAPDIEALVKFLVVDKGFNEDRVRSGAARLTKGLKTSTQARLGDFFKPIPKTAEELEALKKKNETKAAEKKRKAKSTAETKKGGGGKKPKLGGA